MNVNFMEAVRKYELNAKGNNPIYPTELIKRHVEICKIFSSKILKLSPSDVEANKRYKWTFEVLPK